MLAYHKGRKEQNRKNFWKLQKAYLSVIYILNQAHGLCIHGFFSLTYDLRNQQNALWKSRAVATQC